MRYRDLIITDQLSGEKEVIRDFSTMPVQLRYQYLEWKLESYEEDKVPVQLDWSFGL